MKALRIRKSILSIFFLMFVISSLGFLSCDDEDTTYMLEQYNYGDTSPWQRFTHFTNLCSRMLCDPHDSLCTNSLPDDNFRIFNFEYDTDYEWKRDRFMFFEGCSADSPYCTDVPFFAEGDSPYRVAGGYKYWEGDGEAFWDMGPVGHIRHYQRGQCSASIPLSFLMDAKDTFASGLAKGFEKSFAINNVSVQENNVKLYLGSESCNWSRADNKDFVHFHIRFRVKPLSAGHWYWDLDLWFRLVGKRRVQNLYCPGGKDCQTLTCSSDSDCSEIAGANCNALGFCQKTSFLDVESYGAQNVFERHCEPAGVVDLVCKSYYNTFKSLIKSYTNTSSKLHKNIYAPLIDGMHQAMWAESPIPCDVDCQGSAQGTNFEARCNEETNLCEYRPQYIYGVNFYPDELEMILARDQGDPEDNWITGVAGLCDESMPGWSRTSYDWPLR